MTLRQPTDRHGGNAKNDEAVTTMVSKAIASLDAWLAQAETLSRVAGIRFNQNSLAVRRGTNVAGAQHCFRAGLTLDRERPLLGVRRVIMNVVPWDTADRLVSGPIDIGIGIAPR